MPPHDRHLSTIFLSFSVSLPQKPVYGLRPMLTISSAVMFFMPLLSVSTTLITLASSAALYWSRLLLITVMPPPNDGWKAERVRSNVDLPDPLGPSRHVRLLPYSLALRPEEMILFSPFIL